MGSVLNRFKIKQRDCPMHSAILKGDAEKVDKLLFRNPSLVNSSKERGMLPLHHAALIGSSDIVASLLLKGANVDSKTENGTTALHIACDKGFTEVVECILNFGASVNDVFASRQKSDGYYPLHLAVRNNSRDILNLLLKHGADVDSVGADGKTALHLAVDRGCLEIIEDLLTHGSHVERSARSSGDYSLPAVARHSKEESSTELRLHEDALGTKNSDIEYSGASVHNRHGKTINDSYLLHKATRKGDCEMATLLINHGARLDALDEEGKTPMHHAVENGDSKLTKILVDSGFRLKDKIELLGISARKGNKEIVECLLKSDVDVEASDEIGRRALHFAVLYHNAGIAKFLLKRGADVNGKQADGTTALHIASRNGSELIVKMLLEHGARVHCTDERDRTALHVAAGGYGDYDRVVRSLLERGADADFRDRAGKTALHVAARKQHVRVVEELFEHGVDFNAVDMHGKTALDYAFVDRYTISKVFCVLAKHLDMAKACDLFVNETSLYLVDSVSYLHDFYTKYDRKTFQEVCREEVEAMKFEIMGDGVSFHDFLTKDIDRIVAYSRNESVIGVLELGVHRSKYPIFASKLDNRLRRGKRKRDLMERAEQALSFLVEISLPRLVVQKIFEYLDGSDIESLSRANVNSATDCKFK